MSEREHEKQHKPEDPPATEPPSHDEDGHKSGMHRPSTDPRKQIPATEGGET